jgi:hypothetical protein
MSGRDSVNPAHVAFATGVGLLAVGIGAKTATPLAYVGGTFVAAVLFIGPAAPLSAVAGLVIHDLYRGAFGYSTVVVAAWILAFAGLVVWLTGPTATRSESVDLQSLHRTAPAYTGMVMIAGIFATAFAAWLVTLLGWQRFYTAAIGFLPGIAVALGVCVLGLVSVGSGRRLGLLSDRRYILPVLAPGVSDRERSARQAGTAAIGAFIIGIGWLGGVLTLDLFVHDLDLFATASQFRAYVTGFLGTSSPSAAVGTALIVGVYQYGELAVLLSAPVAVLALWGWWNYHEVVISSIAHRIKVIGGGLTR